LNPRNRMADRTRVAGAPLVLIANDQEWSARSLESALEPNGFAVVRAFTGAQALERARAELPDVVILDAQMPDMHGFDVCRALRSDREFGPTTPIVITTAGPSGRAQRLEAFEAGAWEFFGQPIDGEALLLKLRTFVQAKLESDRLRQERLLDPDTGLYNRAGLARRAREIGSGASRRHDALACVVLGSGVDSAGEGESREAIERVGRVLRRAGRSSDALGRLESGDFGVVAPATGAQGAVALVRRLAHAIETSPESGPDGAGAVMIRAGYCAVPDFAASTLDAVQLLDCAATALHDLLQNPDGERIREFDQTSLRT
jgi:PleD family two-component response regulator